MHKRLITILIFATLLGGCSVARQVSESATENAAKLSLMYRPTIQQGNVIDQDMVNKLKPGMTKRQVTYTLGTPALIDSFHQDRWDYVYSLKESTEDLVIKDLVLFFENDRLVAIEGDLRPMPVDEMAVVDKKETIVDVPDHEPENKGIIRRTLEAVGVDVKED